MPLPESNGTPSQPIIDRIEKILHPDHPLCRDDLIWMLDYIKKKVADEDPELLRLPQPRLLKNFYHFAEIAMLLIHSRSGSSDDNERLRSLLAEAAYGLTSKQP